VEAVYTTREILKRGLNIAETAHNNNAIDRAIQSGSRMVEGLCNRRFYPMTATKYFDWPNSQNAVAWRLWMDETELISVSALSSGGTTIASTDYILEPNRVGPPYNRVEILLSSSASFGGSSTYQRSVTITGLWGYANDETTVGTVVEVLDAAETGIDVDGATSSAVGVGSILRVDTERIQVTSRTQLDTGQNLATTMTAQANSVTVGVQDGTQISVDEVITIDSESMLVTNITGNNLTVMRGWDGTVLAAHSINADIYAPRTLVVKRGALGTTAATHLTAAPIYRWDPPGGIQQLTTAHAIHELMQEQTGWFRTMSASSNFGGATRRSASLEALMDLRDLVRQRYGRKARSYAI
jgi:hypothetical protein